MKKWLTFSVLMACCQQVVSQCNSITTGTPFNVTQTTAQIPINDNTSGTFTYYVEYGAPGFTPGTNANAGPGGTVVIKPANQSVVLTGLTPATNYHFYARKSCGGGQWSPNSAVRNLFTATTCTGLSNISCGTMKTNSFISGVGAWNSCGGGQGREIIYSFTPSVTGIHVLVIPQHPSRVDYSFKEVSAGCSQANWTCIGYNFNTGLHQIPFGPLTSGVPYYFKADPAMGIPSGTSFRIECGYCPQPTAITFTNVGATGFKVNYTGAAGYLEYGPSGFVPGSGLNPGPGGTVISVSNGATVSGFTPNSYYDVYIRSVCNGNVGPNSFTSYIALAACPPTSSYGALGSTFQVPDFGMFAQYGVYGYIPGCSYPGFGDEHILKFNPPSTGRYDVTVSTSLFTWGGGNPNPDVNLYLRASNGTCNTNNYVCQQPSSIPFSTVKEYAINTPTAGISYDLLIDAQDSGAHGQIDISILCGKPHSVVAGNITSTSANITFVCNCPNATYLEYGPAGFTPGTGITAGGGTLLSNVSSPVSLTNLSGFTAYDVYLRTSCGGSFSANQKVSFKTLHNCATAPVLACGTDFDINLNMGGGQWSSYNCGTLNATSTEYVFRFVPSQTGMYVINNVYSIGYGSTPLNVYYKTAGGTCNASGWTCGGTITSAPQSLTFGPLTGGTTYILLFDGQLANNFKKLNIGCYQCAASITPGGPTTFCQGGSVSLQASTGGGITYKWYKNGAVIAGATASSYLATTSGYYHVVETKSCGVATSFQVVVTVNQPPAATVTASGPLTFCSGDSVILSTTAIPGGTYKWKKNNTTIGGATSSSYTAKTTGTYKLVKTTSNGCSATSGPVSVTVNNKPGAVITAQGPTTFCAGDSVKLSANTGTNLSYQWRRNNNNITGATASNYTAKTAGTYKVNVTNIHGCTKLSAGTAVSVPCREGDTAEDLLQAEVYPNPSSGDFTFSLPADEQSTTEINIFDITGRIISRHETGAGETSATISIESPGMYRAVVIQGARVQQLTLVKTN